MRYTLFFLLLPFLSFSQVIGEWPGGRLEPVFQTGGTAPFFQFQALIWNESQEFIDTTGLSSSRLLVHDNGSCYYLEVQFFQSSFPLQSGQAISGIAFDPTGDLAALPTGSGALYLPMDTTLFRAYLPYLPQELQACAMTQNFLEIQQGSVSPAQVAQIARDSGFIESIIAGANTVVTGAGTIADPIVIAAASGAGDLDSITSVAYALDTLTITLLSGQQFKAEITSGLDTAFVSQLASDTAQAYFLMSLDSIAANLDFNSDRQILRTPTVGTNIGGTSVNDWLEWWYFTAPTISLAQAPATPTVIEVGTQQTYEYNSTTTNAGGATLSNGEIFRVSPANTFLNFGAATSGGPVTIQYGPNQAQSGQAGGHFYQFRATQDWAFGSESGTATSNTRTIQAVYPVLYGMAADTATVFADAYGTLAKLVETEGNKTVSLTGSGLIFYAFPASWADTNLSSIIDPNGFNVTASFTRIATRNVTSTGLANNWTAVPYVFYFLNTGVTTTSASQYTFNQ